MEASIILDKPIRGAKIEKHDSHSLRVKETYWYEVETRGQKPILAVINGRITISTIESFTIENSIYGMTIRYRNVYAQFYDAGRQVKRGEVIGLSQSSRNLILIPTDSSTGNFVDCVFID